MNMPRSIAGFPRPPPSSSCGMSSVSIYTPRRRETEWSELRNGRDLNPGPPDPEFEVLTARLQTRLHECALSCKSIALSIRLLVFKQPIIYLPLST